MKTKIGSANLPTHHRFVTLDIPLCFMPVSGLESEPLRPGMAEKIYKASQKESGLSREIEVMVMVYANTTIMNMLREKFLPRWGYAHLTPLNDVFAHHNVPISYGSMFHATNPERYRGSWEKYLFNEERYGWRAPRQFRPDTELVTFKFASEWFDKRWQMPSPIESFVTTLEWHAEDVEQTLTHLVFENLLN